MGAISESVLRQIDLYSSTECASPLPLQRERDRVRVRRSSVISCQSSVTKSLTTDD